MTLVFAAGSENSKLLQVQFGLNELASGLILSKHFGSVFSRQNDASIFRLISQQCGVSIKSVPAWLKDFRLSRSTKMHGLSMRILQGPRLMEDIRIDDIEGFAAVIVLCTRYAEPMESALFMVRTINVRKMHRD